MTDLEFLLAFERCETPDEGFHHEDHIRLAWIYVKHYDPSRASVLISAAIRNFAAHHRKPDKYHETVTVAWIHLVKQASHCASFAEVADEFPEFLDKSYLTEFYSSETLQSDAARTSFIAPDKKALPSPSPSVVK